MRNKLSRMLCLASVALLGACASSGYNMPSALRGTGDLGVIIERASGSVQIVDNSQLTSIASVTGLG
ncbi:MAG: protein nirF, partial [Burkholderiales bacterium]|nr:protein nirF [Burkholderiales bacterium]